MDAFCWSCHRVSPLCLCSRVQAFDWEPRLAILVHRKEFRKTVGTARLVKLSVAHSRVFVGHGPDFDEDAEIQSLISDPALFPVLLFPGPKSVNLTQTSPEALRDWIPRDRRLAIIVVDGSWSLARKMIRTSRSLSQLPRISFDVSSPSNYRFRRQPRPYCLSTVEAIHLLMESLHRVKIAELPARGAHHAMLEVFDWLVETQIRYERDAEV